MTSCDGCGMTVYDWHEYHYCNNCDGKAERALVEQRRRMGAEFDELKEKFDRAVGYAAELAAQPADTEFIRHIQSHLAPGEKVICKICGKTAEEICGVRDHPHGTGQKTADTVAPQYPGFPQEADLQPTPPAEKGEGK